MKKFIEQKFLSGSWFTFGFVVINAALFVAGWFNCLNENTWPSWIQGIGSIEAILIAIWVAYKQRSDILIAEKDSETEEVYRLKMAIGEELAGFYKSYYFPHTVYLTSRSSEMIFDISIPIFQYNFPVYNAVVGRLTMIPDPHLRTTISDVYRLAGNLLNYSLENNRLLDEVRRIQAIPGYTENFDLLCQYNMNHVAMQELCSRMRSLSAEVPVRARSVAENIGIEFS